jgi:hypothetical protein
MIQKKYWLILSIIATGIWWATAISVARQQRGMLCSGLTAKGIPPWNECQIPFNISFLVISMSLPLVMLAAYLLLVRFLSRFRNKRSRKSA